MLYTDGRSVQYKRLHDKDVFLYIMQCRVSGNFHVTTMWKVIRNTDTKQGGTVFSKIGLRDFCELIRSAGTDTAVSTKY
jgi:hypothetical protein